MPKTEPKKQELKPCWSCGHEMYVGKHMYCDGKYIVRCGSDGKDCIWFPSSGAINKADIPAYITAWNTREESKQKTICCPECGSVEYVNVNLVGEGYRCCRDCKQDWWIDVEYSLPLPPPNIEKANEHIYSLVDRLTAAEKRVKELEVALRVISQKIPYQACRLCELLGDEPCDNFDKYCCGTISRQALAKDNLTAICNAATEALKE